MFGIRLVSQYRYRFSMGETLQIAHTKKTVGTPKSTTAVPCASKCPCQSHVCRPVRRLLIFSVGGLPPEVKIKSVPLPIGVCPMVPSDTVCRCVTGHSYPRFRQAPISFTRKISIMGLTKGSKDHDKQ